MSEEILEKIKEMDTRMKEGHNLMMEKMGSIQDHVDEIGQTLGITEKQTEGIQGNFEQTETIIQQIKKIYSSTQQS
ncbi:hypothetical protein [Rossellomorea marisflavi]|uniref:hypothetical protein n=1 Tax=Rossellomorea marisflavi TaxID=189381 RepID=UPI00064EA9FB|nr:hypothetical protein [Rossellomorea marisflavi]KML32379.1 hypothetical protein VL12_15385 [Rossellomorea marisflavi]